MPALHLDFETRSTVDLRKTGVYPYAEHPDTAVWCACYAVDDEPVQVWRPGEPVPPAWTTAVRDGWDILAHNAQFERVMVERLLAPRHGWPVPALDQWHCTAAMAAAMSIPRSLEDAAKVMGLPVEKDMDGRRLMLQMAKPRRTNDGALRWWDEPTKVERLIAYCKTDVEVERQLDKRLRRLSPAERRVYLLDQRINDRGIRLDLALVHAARELTVNAQAMLNAELTAVTAGWVQGATKAKDLTIWLNAEGIETDSVNKAAVRSMLADTDVAGAARRAVEIRAEAAKSSTAKLRAMLGAACADDRVRGLLLYHGAGTGRWSGRLVQPQNFPRESAEDETIDFVLRCADPELIGLLFGPPLGVVASLLRPCLVAGPGHDLLAADYSNIEGRGVAWLAGEAWKLDAFRAYDAGTGPDLYKLTYARSFALSPAEVSKDQRQIGKVMELSMGYQGGVGAFQAMASNYGVRVPDAEADRLKNAWRDAHPRVVRLWRDLEQAAIEAVEQPGAVIRCCGGRIAFRVKGGFLWMVLPSGRPLAYATPKIERVEMPWTDDAGNPAMKDAVTYWGVDSRTRKWSKQKGYGGLWTENAVQALCRDLMACGMERLEAAGYPVVLTVHDEVVTEPPEDHGTVEAFEDIMCELPPWAVGLPVAAEGWRGKRYRK